METLSRIRRMLNDWYPLYEKKIVNHKVTGAGSVFNNLIGSNGDRVLRLKATETKHFVFFEMTHAMDVHREARQVNTVSENERTTCKTLETRQKKRQNRSSNPYQLHALGWSNHLDFNRGWNQRRQFLRHVLKNPLENGRATTLAYNSLRREEQRRRGGGVCGGGGGGGRGGGGADEV